jgi:hypothetical protein
MDGKGARILRLRIAIGAAPGERVEVVSVAGPASVTPGSRGTLVFIGEDCVRLALDTGEEVVVDPLVVQLRRVLVA